MCPHSQGRLLALAICVQLAAGSATADAESVLLDERELGVGWDVLREAPVDASRDPDLREWGVRATHARHYTRDLYGRIQVCSVEIWEFESEAQARAAEQGFRYPGWEISRAGTLLVMARGLVQMRGRPPSRGVFPECSSIASRILARARDLR